MKTIGSFSRDRSRLLRRAAAVMVLGASLLFLGYSVYANWQQLRDYHWHFNYLYLFLAAVALFLAFISNVGGWALIIRHMGGPRSLRKNVAIYCLAAHGKRLPGFVWYVAGRVYLYEREDISASVIVQGSLWELILQILSGLVLYAILWPLYSEVRHTPFDYLPLVAIPVFFLTLFPFVFQWLLRWLKRGQPEVPIIQVGWRTKVLWFSVYLLGWLAGGAILYFLAGAVSAVSVSLLPACWGFVALSGVISALTFFLPGGVGAREVSLSLLLSYYIPLPVAVALSVLFRVWILVGETVLLVIFWGIARGRL